MMYDTEYLKTMADRDKRIEELVNRSFDERTLDLARLIEQENLFDYELGYEDILWADSANNAIVPCEEYLVLAHEHYDEQSKRVVSEYAIYSQEDHDGNPLRNSLNMNATYHYEYVCSESFPSMAAAIAHAYNAITNGTAFADPVDIVMNMTEPGEDLTEKDAGRILSEAKAQGWNVPPCLTPSLFLEIYADLEPTEEK